ASYVSVPSAVQFAALFALCLSWPSLFPWLLPASSGPLSPPHPSVCADSLSLPGLSYTEKCTAPFHHHLPSRSHSSATSSLPPSGVGPCSCSTSNGVTFDTRSPATGPSSLSAETRVDDVRSTERVPARSLPDTR